MEVMLRSHKKLFGSLMGVIMTFSMLVAPAQAELSPDAGLEPEEIAVQEAEKAQMIKEEEAKEKAADAEKKRLEKARVAAKAKAEAAAKAKAAAEEAAKHAIATSAVIAPNLFGSNVSLVAKDLPEGLSPKLVATALSVNAGQKASLTVKTLPGATCDIDVFVVTRTPVVASGLEDKTADADGICSWTWVVKSGTKRGSWGVKVAAAKDGKTDDTWTTLNIGAVH